MSIQQSRTTAAAQPTPDRTGFAVPFAIVAVLPALIPAAIAVFVYCFLAAPYFMSGSWIPYLDQIGAVFFPEFLRGAIVGMVVMGVTSWLFKNFNESAVRYATLAFWAGAVVLLLVLSIPLIGMSWNTLGSIAVVLGLAVGLWSNDLSKGVGQ